MGLVRLAILVQGQVQPQAPERALTQAPKTKQQLKMMELELKSEVRLRKMLSRKLQRSSLSLLTLSFNKILLKRCITTIMVVHPSNQTLTSFKRHNWQYLDLPQ